MLGANYFAQGYFGQGYPMGVIKITVTDEGSIEESFSFFVRLIVDEVIVSDESPSEKVRFIIGDSCNSDEGLGFFVKLVVPENRIFTDSVSIKNSFELSDTVSAEDVENWIGKVLLEDSAEITEATPELSIKVTVSDKIKEIDYPYEGIFLQVDDAIVTEDEIAVKVSFAVSDSADVVDTVSWLNKVMVSDFMSADDTLLELMNRLVISDPTILEEVVTTVLSNEVLDKPMVKIIKEEKSGGNILFQTIPSAGLAKENAAGTILGANEPKIHQFKIEKPKFKTEDNDD